MNHLMNNLMRSGDKRPRFFAVLVVLAILWGVFALNFITAGTINAWFAVEPRQLSGLFGVLTYAFAHKDLGHIVANSVPFVVLSLFIAYKDGLPLLFKVWILALLGSGIGVWLFGSHGRVIGASGVVFALNGFLLARTCFQPSLGNIVVGVVTLLLYSGVLYQLFAVNTPGISWSCHVCGFVSGVATAFLLSDKR